MGEIGVNDVARVYGWQPPDPSISEAGDRPRSRLSDRILLWSIGFTVGILTGGAVALGTVAITDDDIDPSGHKGQVYVVDSGRWVDADDHAAHTEHE